MQRKGDSAMKFHVKPQYRVLFGKFVSVGFAMVLLALSLIVFVIGLFAYSSIKTFFYGLFVVGFRSIFSMTFSFFLTAILIVATWFFFSLVLGVWKEFGAHRQAQKALTGS